MIVKKVYVFVGGDPSVGIPHGYYGADIFFDVDCLDEEDREGSIEELRMKFKEAYEIIHGYPVTVTFDFEEDREDESN
jgi:hypothetical protein